MTPEREEQIKRAWDRGACRMWRWHPAPDGMQPLEYPLEPTSYLVAPVAPGDVVNPTTIERLTFLGSYATMPGGSGPDRPRYRFITCEGLIVHQERVG